MAEAEAGQPEIDQATSVPLETARSERSIAERSVVAQDPPHGVPLPTLVVTVDAKALTDTVNWLCGQIQDHQKSIDRLRMKVNEADSEAKLSLEKQADAAEATESRFAMLEKLLMRGGGGGGGGEPATEAAQEAPSEGIPKELLSTDLEQLVRQLELDVSNLNIKVKKTDQYIKHQEAEQVLRDQAQDELLKMELDRIKNDLETCLREKDLELMRTNMLAKIENIHNEVKEDLQRLAGDFKGTFGERMNLISESLEKIATANENQVKLLNDKVDNNTMDDDRRHSADMKKFAAVEKMMKQIARHVGVEVETEVDLTATTSSAAAGALDRSLSMTGGGGAPLAGGAVSGPGLQRLEKRVERLAFQLGVPMASLDSDEPLGGAADQSPAEPGSPGLPKTPKPLPTRVEKLEVQQTQLTEALQENLGLVLPGAEVPQSWSPDSVRQRSTQSIAVQAAADPPPPPPAAEERPGTAGHGQALRLDAIEARLREIGVAVGLEVAEVSAEPPEGRPATAMRPLPIRVDLLDAKMDEVATMVNLTSEELEAAALGQQRGTLAGRVMLREQTEAVSPRMAGIIASQEDRLKSQLTAVENLEHRLTNEMNDVWREMDATKKRLEVLEGKAGLEPPVVAASGTAEEKSGKEPKEKSPKREKTDKAEKKDKGAAPTETKAKDVGEPSPSGSAGGASSAEVTVLKQDVQDLRKVCDEMRSKMKDMRVDIEKARKASVASRADAPPASQEQSTQQVSEEAASAAIQRAESAAEAAEKSAAAAGRLREELEEILRAIEVPAAGLFGSEAGANDLFEDAFPPPAADNAAYSTDEARAAAEAESAAQYMERQMEIETRLEQLEEQLGEQLESSSQPGATSEMLGGMKMVIKDVRKCLQRCELLFQLPEIKQFVNKFRRSLEVNAILHERWIGPRTGAKAPGSNDAGAEERPSSALGEERRVEGGYSMSKAQAQSMPDLKSKGGNQPRVKKGDGKKKPFRTVVDWCRPHTPLTLDPQYGKKNDERPSEAQVTNLPPINR